MLSLAIRTDKPEAELYLFEDNKALGDIKWEAHRQLSETIHKKIEELLGAKQKKLNNIQGIIVFKGPGSFTGLRIGITVANALAYGLKIPVVGKGGQNWIDDGIASLNSGADDKIVLPEYGSEPHITQQKR